jgi:hypothetical protein
MPITKIGGLISVALEWQVSALAALANQAVPARDNAA